MRIENGMGPDFKRWQDPTDAYARNIEAIFRNEPGAAAELVRLTKAIEKCETDLLEFATGGPAKHSDRREPSHFLPERKRSRVQASATLHSGIEKEPT